MQTEFIISLNSTKGNDHFRKVNKKDGYKKCEDIYWKQRYKKSFSKKKSTKEKMDNFYKAKVDNFEVCPISVSTLVHELKCSQNIDRLI